MITVLVTGGIGSGKSAVCRHLESQGIPVYYSDARAKDIYDNLPGVAARVDAAVGGGVLTPEGRVDRRLLAERVFSSAEKLSALESIIHPAVLEDFLAWGRSTEAEMVVMESAIALRLESYMRVFDAVVLVDAPAEIRLQRACERDSSTVEAVQARMDKQKFDRSLVNAVILNDSTLDILYERTDRAFEEILVYLQNNQKTSLNNTMKTDLTRILSVSGQHGLYLYIAQARTGAIAECLADKKRTVFDMRSRITTLADISIYTSEGELKLQDVFNKLHEVLGENDAPTSKASADELKALFAQAVPDYDADRFYVSHMKKVVDWYNDLKNNASLDFATPEDLEAEAEAAEAAEDAANE